MRYTRPERAAAWRQNRALAARIRDNGGCAHCIHRDMTLAGIGTRAACGHATPKQFPNCIDDEEGFECDEATLQNNRNDD